MDLRFLTEYCVPVILAACLVIGYCIKHISWLDKVGNQYIPVIMAVLGLLISIPVTLGAGRMITVETLVSGAVTGLASAGLHQTFKAIIDQTNEKENKNE